jgi:hypothetical protein
MTHPLTQMQIDILLAVQQHKICIIRYKSSQQKYAFLTLHAPRKSFCADMTKKLVKYNKTMIRVGFRSVQEIIEKLLF